MGGSLLKCAVPIQRNWPANRRIRAETLVTVLDIQLVVEDTPPQHHRFPGQVRVDFVIDPVHRNPGITADLTPFGFARECTEPLPTAYGSYTGGRQILEPVLHPRMRLRTVLHSVVPDQEVHEPSIGFFLVLGLVKVVKGFVHLLHRSKRPFDLTFGMDCELHPMQRIQNNIFA